MFASPQINIYSEDVERGVDFYRGLGFEETFRTPSEGEADHVELRLDGFTLGVASTSSLEEVHGVEPDGGGGIEVVLWTDDVDAAFERLVAAGAPPRSAPHDFLDGALRSAWVADPDGNPIQLVRRRS